MTRLLVFAPHPDDEILGCAGLMQRLVREGLAVHVVVVTDGAAGGIAAIREQECAAGLACLGVNSFEFWRFPDSSLPLHDAIGARYRQCVQQWKPTDIALPAPSESHPDHRRLTRGVLDFLTGQWAGQLWFYETTSPMPNVNHTEALDLDVKLAAMACHASQSAQFDYAAMVSGLAMLRGASTDHRAAEAFCRFDWDGSRQNFFEHRPLVSVIVRAEDPELLPLALDSLSAQSYDHLEVVLVWFGAHALPVFPTTLRVRVVQGPGPRSANLNLGVAQAQGAFVAFLDQDDVWLPDHLANLLPELMADDMLDLAYGDYETVVCRRTSGGVDIVNRGPRQGQDHRPGRLLAGNHIAFNTFVCRRRLAFTLKFDEALDAYEDWDFLVRAELALATFKRVPEIVSEYRVYPLEGEAGDLQAVHQRKGYLRWRDAVLQKMLPLLTPKALADVFQSMADFESECNTFQQQLHHTRSDRDAARRQLLAAEQVAGAARRWAERLVPQQVGGDPVSALAGCAMRGPCIAVVMPVCDPEPAFLAEAVHSVMRQTYPNWQLCIADDASQLPAVLAMLDSLTELAQREPRLRIVRRTTRGGIVAASTSAIVHADAPWLAFLDHDDRLHPDALLEMAAEMALRTDLECLYTDSRTMDRNGVVLHTFSKPDWAPETLLHLNYINHFSAVRRDVFDAVGGLRAGFDGSQDWDLWLRLAARPRLQVAHLALPLYDWRATETSVAYAMAAKPYVLDAARRCTTTYLLAKGLKDVCAEGKARQSGLRYLWAPNLLPLTVIVPTHRNPADLERLLSSLLASGYPDLQLVLIANNVSDDDALTHAQLDRARAQPGWRVEVDNRAFNWAELNNAAVAKTNTPALLFLNDDVELVGEGSLQRLVSYLMLDPRIGAVGARLLHDVLQGGGVQHDGVVTEQGWIARNIDCEIDGTGLGMPRNVSAVTGASLLTRRECFDAVGGFDERFQMSYNDVDYCLQLRANGYRVVQASDVEWVHRESRTRGALDSDAKRDLLAREGHLMREKWGDFLDEKFRLIYHGRFTTTRIIHVPTE
jgi:GT2 family glycosyltransferase/LmbE family N-acetylglucosaminyl deacetylase